MVGPREWVDCVFSEEFGGWEFVGYAMREDGEGWVLKGRLLRLASGTEYNGGIQGMSLLSAHRILRNWSRLEHQGTRTSKPTPESLARLRLIS